MADTVEPGVLASATHEVFNQPAPLVDYNLFDTNRPLRDALRFLAPGLETSPLSHLGARLGSAEMQGHARMANVHPPGCEATTVSAGAPTRWNFTRATTR